MDVEIGNVEMWAIVRLPDGRVGMKGQHPKRGKALVLFGPDTNLGTVISTTTRVTVVQYPAQLAGDWLAHHTLTGDGGVR